MKKTLNITIGGRVFAIEDDAYERLKTYLNEVRTIFHHYPDTDEIVADMEDRMADQFENQGNTTERCITLANVTTLIATMGSADDLRQTIEGEEPVSEQETAAREQPIVRKLYRNSDDKILFGVCSGIAAYFGIDPVLVRLVFVGFTLLGGSGVVLYLIFYFIMPEAKTTTEKMAMRGEPITLAGVIEQVKSEFTEEKNKERVATMKRTVNETSQKIFHDDPSSIGGRILRAMERILQFIVESIRRFFERVVPIIIRISGVGVLGFGLFALFAPVAGGTFVLTNSAMVLAPWDTIVSKEIVVLITLLGMAAVCIPAVLILLLGISMVRCKNSFPGRLTGVLAALWIIIMFTGASVIISHLPRWTTAYDVENKTTSITVPITQSFTKVGVYDRYYHRIRIMGGTTTTVRLTGDAFGIDQVKLEVEHGELKISKQPKDSWRFFEGKNEPEIVITVPVVDEVTLQKFSTVEISNLRQAKIAIKAYNGSVEAVDNEIDAYQIWQHYFSDVHIKNGTTTLRAELHDNEAHLTTLGATLLNPEIKLADGATAHLGFVTGTISVTANNGSRLYYLGNPMLNSNLSEDSEVVSYPAALWNDEERARYYGQEE